MPNIQEGGHIIKKDEGGEERCVAWQERGNYWVRLSAVVDLVRDKRKWIPFEDIIWERNAEVDGGFNLVYRAIPSNGVDLLCTFEKGLENRTFEITLEKTVRAEEGRSRCLRMLICGRNQTERNGHIRSWVAFTSFY